NPRGDQVQGGLDAIDHQRVAGVVAALEAGHGGHQVGEQIDDLALAFVTPLGAQHNYVFSHVNRSKDRSDNRFEGDSAVLDHQQAVAAQFREIGFAVVKATHHPLPGGAQVADGL